MFGGMKTPLDRLASTAPAFAPTVLRLGLAAVFLAHAWAKVSLFTLPGTAAFFEQHGFPGWTAYPVFAIELAGAVALALGFQVRATAAILAVVMVGALVPHVHNGWMFTNAGGGWEYVAFLLVALAAQGMLGAGRWTALARAEDQRRPSTTTFRTASGE